MMMSPGIVSKGGLLAWNPADKTATVTLSAQNRKQTTSGPAVTDGVRSENAKTTGKYHFEITIDSINGQFPVHGFATAAHNLTNNTAGNDLTSVIVQTNGQVYLNGALLTTVDTYIAGNTLAFEIDFATMNMWIEKLGGTGRKGPISLSAMTAPLFIFAENQAGSAQSSTLNTGQAAMAITPTAGFTAGW